MTNDFKTISKPINELMKTLAYEKLATRHYQKRCDDVAIQVQFQLSNFDTSFYVNVVAGTYQNDEFLPILNSRLSQHAIGGDDDIWQNDDGNLLARLSGALSQILPLWEQVYCEKNNLNHAITHYDLNVELLANVEKPNEFLPLTGQAWANLYQTWHDELLAQGFKAKITDDNVFYFKPLENSEFWAVLWCQLVGFGAFLQVKVSVWHSLLQVNDDTKNGTPADYDSPMILFYETLQNDKTAWFVGNHQADWTSQNIANWRALLPQTENYWANFNNGKDVVNAIPMEYQRSSYFSEIIEVVKRMN